MNYARLNSIANWIRKLQLLDELGCFQRQGYDVEHHDGQ